MTVHFGDQAATISTVDAAAASASVSLSLPALPGVSMCSLVFYAAAAGAFVDLAADSRAATGDGQVILDGHLPLPTSALYPGDAIEILQLSQIDQAVGVLIEAGHTSAGARDLLQVRADRHGITLAASAQQELRRLS